MNRLNNKTVMITGATSGIGKACAEAFAGEGCNLILTGRRSKLLSKLCKELADKFSIKVKAVEFDVRSKNEVINAFSSLGDEWSKIDILVNNAGLARGLATLQEGDTDKWEEMIDTNVKGLLYVTRQALPLMIARNAGHIINIGSIAGHETYPKGNVYAATKFAVNGISRSMRMDVLGTNIRVSSVDPGLVETEFSIVRFSGDIEKADKVYEGIKPLTPEDVAETVLFCASRREHVNIDNVILTPLCQASTTMVHR